jgi:hypothetical protein
MTVSHLRFFIFNNTKQLSQNDPAISAIKRSIILRLKTICEESLNSDGQHFNQYQQNDIWQQEV